MCYIVATLARLRLGVFTSGQESVGFDIAPIRYRATRYRVLTVTCSYIRAITVYLTARTRARSRLLRVYASSR